MLSDATRLHLFAGGHRADTDDQPFQANFDLRDCEWLCIEEDDRSVWTSLFQEAIAIDALAPGNIIPNLKQYAQAANLSAVTGLASFPFITGVPLTSRSGHNIGTVCVVCKSERQPLSTGEAEILANMARRCMDVLDLARERKNSSRWSALQEELDVFLQSRTLRAQLLQETQTPAKLKSAGPAEGNETACAKEAFLKRRSQE